MSADPTAPSACCSSAPATSAAEHRPVVLSYDRSAADRTFLHDPLGRSAEAYAACGSTGPP
jgi:hypothetical protein